MMLFLTIAVAALAALLFTAGGTAACAQEELRLPIVMYHDLTSNPLEQDDYTLSLEQLEQDLIAFEEHGFTPVSLSSVLRYVLDGGALPEKPVLLVFDDGYHSFFTGALPLLLEHRAPAVVSVIGREAEEASHETCSSFYELDGTEAGGELRACGADQPFSGSARLLQTVRSGASVLRK